MACVGRLLQQGEKVSCQNNVAEVGGSHVFVNSVRRCELLRHDSPRGVVDQNVNAVGFFADLAGYV